MNDTSVGWTYWAYSYLDNRDSMAIVAYDASNDVVLNVEQPGARYLVEIDIDYLAQTARFVGQVGENFTKTWLSLRP